MAADALDTLDAVDAVDALSALDALGALHTSGGGAVDALDRVLCTLAVTDGRACLGVHVIPGAYRVRVHAALTPAFPTPEAELVARAVIEHLALCRTRDLLATLDLLVHEVQHVYDRQQRAQTRAMGRPHALGATPCPLLAHDACTLYCALALSALPTSAARREALGMVAGRELPLACPACGLERPWSVSCYVPRGAKRRALDSPVAWCWQCRHVLSASAG